MKHTGAARGRSRGFTLVEMLIVIIIIGILAGMMMLSTGAATDKAEATRIVSDMRSMKTACVMYYADSGEWPEAINASFDKYLDVPVSDNDDYSLTTSENVLWLSYKAESLPRATAYRSGSPLWRKRPGSTLRHQPSPTTRTTAAALRYS